MNQPADFQSGSAGENEVEQFRVEGLVKPANADFTQLAELLCDSVRNGASVNFVQVPTVEFAEQWWRNALAEPEDYLFVARNQSNRIVGCVRLMPAPQENGQHRADVGKLLVHSEYRNRGIAGALMLALEAKAAEIGRTLLLLDTETGSYAESFYRQRGWIEFGVVPGHTVDTRGELTATTYFLKQL